VLFDDGKHNALHNNQAFPERPNAIKRLWECPVEGSYSSGFRNFPIHGPLTSYVFPYDRLPISPTLLSRSKVVVVLIIIIIIIIVIMNF
jgi:hypothetical protein